ncbi:MAG: hypothetical protein ACON47_04805 [Flavobacteriaceae bacterium]
MEKDITDLQAELAAVNLELASLKTTNAEMDVIIANLQRSNSDFAALYESDFIGCWYTTNSALQGANTEIQIYPGGVGSLDFGGGVYQVFSWSQRNGVTTLHFGDVLICSCFGVDYNFIMDSAQILYGEMFDQDHSPTIKRNENDKEYFELIDWAEYPIIFDRCIVN